jgi:hypothetical protein
MLVWFRDKLFGKKKDEDLHWYTQASPHAQKPVEPQITDAVTQSAPVVSAVATGSLAATATAAAATTTKKKPTKTKKSTAAKAKKTK